MDRVLKDVSGSRAYIDDIVVYTMTWEDHLRALKLTLEALHQYGFKVKLAALHQCTGNYRLQLGSVDCIS